LAAAASQPHAEYFPPPESRGGWRVASRSEIPEKTGLRWERLEDAWRYCRSFGGPNQLLVIRHGWIAGEWQDYSDPRGIASCTKSLTALAMARLFDLSRAGRIGKKIGPDDFAWRYLPPEWSASDARKRQIRIRHLMTMSSGLEPYDGPYADLGAYSKTVLSTPVETAPGTTWAYASVPIDLLSLIVENVTGEPMGAFFNREINAAIGAAPVAWGEFEGHTGGSGGPRGGARYSARELARVGYLMLREGRWSDGSGARQVVSRERVNLITRWAPFLGPARYRVPNFAFEKDANRYYGYLWWSNRTGQALGTAVPKDAFYMSGWGKQACWVVPSLDMVVVRLGPNRELNAHPEYYPELWARLMAAVEDRPAAPAPFDGKRFKGRIAYSADGNFNDEDDWAASPAALAILAEFGVKEKLVHFDYNSILPKTDAAWEKEHETSVLGAAKLYGYPRPVFHDCRRDRQKAIASIRKAIDASSDEDPLYFIVAGPMEVAYHAIQKADPARRKHVYVISHSRWNDGFGTKIAFEHNKRSVIPLGIRWVQIADQNRLLSTSPYGRSATEKEWLPWHWMRDSADPKVRFLWDRMRATKRADCSDAGMAYFLLTGDETADPAKLRTLLDSRVIPAPAARRKNVRLEAENFLSLESFELEDRNDRGASHRLNIKLANATTGRIRTPLAEPYSAPGLHDIDVRYLDEAGAGCRYSVHVSGARKGEPWQAPAAGAGWTTHTVADVRIDNGSEIMIEVQGDAGAACRLDYVQLNSK
jgi:CubicO group peptidase (beta-lactamase class C family)